MTTLYRPVPIESAEQAETLPEGTIITHAGNYPQEKFGGLWGREGNSSASLAEEEGWTALVPIEAEEETTEQIQVYLGVAHIGPRSVTPAPSRRLVTPWEEA